MKGFLGCSSPFDSQAVAKRDGLQGDLTGLREDFSPFTRSQSLEEPVKLDALLLLEQLHKLVSIVQLGTNRMQANAILEGNF